MNTEIGRGAILRLPCRALAAGAKSLHELTDQPYGDRDGAVTDPFGNIWYVATHVRDVTP